MYRSTRQVYRVSGVGFVPNVFFKYRLLHIFLRVKQRMLSTVSFPRSHNKSLLTFFEKERPFKVLFMFGDKKKSQGAMSGEYRGWGIVIVIVFGQEFTSTVFFNANFRSSETEIC